MDILKIYKSNDPVKDISEGFAKIVFLSGIILVITLLIDFSATKYMNYLWDVENGKEKYWDFRDSFEGFFKIMFWVSKVCFIMFYIGMLPILINKKAYIPIIVSTIILAFYNLYTYFDYETFNLVFSPERYKISSLIVHFILLIINLILYIFIYIGSKDKPVKLAGRLLIITAAIDIINIISYSIMFTIDSSHFVERFADVIDSFKFYYSYMSSPIYICALVLMLYQIKLFLNYKEETLFDN